MDTNVAVPVRFTLGRQSSLAPEDRDNGLGVGDDELEVLEDIDPTFQLMYLANEGDIEGMSEILDAFGNNVNFKDVDGRTPLHVAACQGLTDVVELLLQRGAEVDPKDRWGSTPLADAIYYKNHNVIKLLEKNGAKPLMAPMHVLNAREVPEYEIQSNELDFTNSVYITKGTFRIASWRGIQVAVKELPEDVVTDENKVRAFSDELSLLQKIRHPNVVQFLGAVTQSSPMMIVTEYLPKGDLRAFLKRKGALKPATAVKFALDIARGMNYLHEHTPGAIIHCDLEPSNILRDDTGHLKVADFGVSKILKFAKTVREDKPLTCQDSSCRYVAPEVYSNEEYDMKVDVFSFALILQEVFPKSYFKYFPYYLVDCAIYLFIFYKERTLSALHGRKNYLDGSMKLIMTLMIEGCPPFLAKQDNEVADAYVEKQRPPFKASAKLYSHGLRELIEECWSENPTKRPTFRQIIKKLDAIAKHLGHKRHWKSKPMKCFHLEAIWRRDHSDSSSHSSGSSSTTH